MESYGLMLKKAREEKNIDILKAARDTSISENYIKALEEENEIAFPGEPYFFGFLKNYAEYLGVNVSVVVSLCKNKKLQETETPFDLLLRPKKRFIFFKIILIPLGILLVLSLVGFLFFNEQIMNFFDKTTSVEVVAEEDEIQQYTLSMEPISRRFYKGDQILVSLKNENIVLTVAGTNGVFLLDMPSGRQYISLSEEAFIDFDDDTVYDLKVYVSDISARNEARGAEVTFTLIDSESEQNSFNKSIDSIENLGNIVPDRVLLSDNRAYPFVINVNFRAPCVFRSAVDSAESIESYYSTGEVVSMTAKNGVRLWVSNGTSARLQMVVNGQTTNIEIGKAGQVFVVDVKWIKDTDGLYKIVILDVN